MFKYRDQVKKEIMNAYTFIIIPKSMYDEPVTIESFKLLDGTYGSIKDLSEELGSIFTPVEVLDGMFIKFRWLLKTNTNAEQNLKYFLQSLGLVDTCSDCDDLSKVDFSNLVGNEFGIFDALTVQSIPTYINNDDEIL